MSRKALEWVGWQVGVPLIAPVGISFLAAAIWAATGPGSFRLSVLLDLSPWALAIYALTLWSTTARDRGRLEPGKRKKGFWWMAGPIGAAEFLLFATLVIRRHEAAYVVPSTAYVLAGGLAFISVVICLIYRVDAA